LQAYSADGVTSIADVPASEMTAEQRLTAAADANLDLSLVRGDDELTRFLEVCHLPF